MKDVEKSIEEHEWKMSHSMRLSYAVILAPVGSVMFVLLICVLRYCCYCWCCQKFVAHLLNGLAMKQIVDLFIGAQNYQLYIHLPWRFTEAVWLTGCSLISRIKLNQRLMQQRMLQVLF